MASVIKVRRKTRAGTTPDGKPIWKPAKGFLYYAKIKTLAGEWTQVPTQKTGTAAAAQWASERCACDRCGGPDRIRERQEKEQAATRASEEAKQRKLCGELMDAWIETLTNRSAKDDKSRMRLHVRPHFASLRPDEVTLPVVMKWIDAQRAIKLAPTVDDEGKPKLGRGRKRADDDGRLSDSTVRHSLNLLSRFLSWCVTRGHAQMNVVRLIPVGSRPRQSSKRTDAPWIDDDKTVRDVMKALAPPFKQMFYLGNRSGLRPGEQRGLRMSDFGFLKEKLIRVRYSDDGPLKEDKRKEGKVKWAPAPDDIDEVIGPWLAKRQAEDAKPEDLVFMPELSRGALKQRMEAAWNETADALGLEMRQYEATRHSMISRNLAAGVPLDEVSVAVGHSTPLTTARHYAHFVRKTFAASLHAGIDAKAEDGEGGELIPLHNAG